jgi:hypothetical protein
MKYKNKSELGTIITELSTSVSAIRAANKKLLKDLQHLDGPDGRKYSEAERLALKGQLRSTAAVAVHRDFIGLRKQIEREAQFWKTEFFGVVGLHNPTTIADESMERLWLAEKYRLLSPARFKEAVQQASEDGRPAELHVARLVMESRDWRSEEEQRDISVALHVAERDVDFAERKESLELLEVASSTLEDAVSSYESLSKGSQDVRLAMKEAMDGRLKKNSDLQSNREQFAKDHPGVAFQL